MKNLIKYTTFVLAVFFVVGFAPTLSAKHHRHCSTSFSLNFFNPRPLLMPAAPVYQEYHYVERTPTYYYSSAPCYRERTIIQPRTYYVERPYRETVVIERDPYSNWFY